MNWRNALILVILLAAAGMVVTLVCALFQLPLIFNIILSAAVGGVIGWHCADYLPLHKP